MNGRLPVEIEKIELPVDKFEVKNKHKNSYGYVSIMYLASAVITLASILLIAVFGR